MGEGDRGRQPATTTTAAAAANGSGLGASDLTVAFAGVKALSGVDFTLHRGEVLGLIGPNGSGKTTLLNVLSGVYKATSGRTFLDGLETTKLGSQRLARLGVARTFQNIRLFGNLTVLHNVEVGSALSAARPRGDALVRAADRTLEELRLTAYRDRYAGDLPYGIRRRIEIARALATQPRYLLLDEPAAGANATESEELSEFIEYIAANYDLGILVIEHDLRLMLRVASRIVALSSGQVIAEGTGEEISQHPTVREAYFGTKSSHTPTSQPHVPAHNTKQEKP